MSHPSSNMLGAQCASFPESDSDSPFNENPTTRPRTNINPSATTVTDPPPFPSSTDPVALLRELCQRESELTKRTSDIEKLLVSITTAINQQQPCPTTSTPIDQPPSHDVPYNSAFSSDQRASPFATAPTFPLASRFSQLAYPESVVREALELVPKFDGHNMPVLQFVRACKRAKELIPLTDEAHLVRLIRNKLTGHAYLAVEDKTHNAVDQLTDCLKRAFGPARNPNYYRGQLSVNYMKEEEHIFDYIGRVKDLRSAIIEADQNLYGRPLTNIELAYVDSFTLESFYDGLPRDLRTELRNEGYLNLNDAYDKAVSATRRLERDIARRRNTRAQPPAPRAFPASQPLNTAAPVQPPVTILKRPSPPPQYAPGPQPPPNQAPFPFQTRICHYCKRFGHLISECRKRQINENNNYTRQGNLPQASADEESRGLSNAHQALPLTENHPLSTSSNPQPGTSRQ